MSQMTTLQIQGIPHENIPDDNPFDNIPDDNPAHPDHNPSSEILDDNTRDNNFQYDIRTDDNPLR